MDSPNDHDEGIATGRGGTCGSVRGYIGSLVLFGSVGLLQHRFERWIIIITYTHSYRHTFSCFSLILTDPAHSDLCPHYGGDIIPWPM